jgi:hypothetical protein
VIDTAQVLRIARDAARRVPLWIREDVEQHVAERLLTERPVSVDDATDIAARAANAMRSREHRHAMRHHALDGARVGVTDTLDDQVAARVLLDAALCAAKTGLDFSSSRTLRKVSATV